MNRNKVGEKFKPRFKSGWYVGLSGRAVTRLGWMNIGSRSEAMKAVTEGKLVPGKYPAGYGWKTHIEICKWLGLPEPQKPPPKPRYLVVRSLLKKRFAEVVDSIPPESKAARFNFTCDAELISYSADYHDGKDWIRIKL